MPLKEESYKLRKVPRKPLYWVVDNSGKHYSKEGLPKEQARQQQKALYAAASRDMEGKGRTAELAEYYSGGGFVDMFNKITGKVKEVVQRAVGVAQKGMRQDLPPKARETLRKYGNHVIMGINIRRDPIQPMLNSALNAITLGSWDRMKRVLNYDKLFHLGLELDVRRTKRTERLLLEKNEVINLGPIKSRDDDTEMMRVDMKGKQLTLNQFIENARNQMGDKFIPYDPFYNNCQDFILNVLRANGLATEDEATFIKQPIEKLIKGIPEFAPAVAKAVTDLGGYANNILEGEGRLDMTTGMFHRAIQPLSGGRVSEAAQRMIERRRAYEKLSPAEKAQVAAEHESQVRGIQESAAARQRQVEEYNAEMKRRRESGFAPVVDALVKAGDFGVKYIAPVVGVPGIVTKAYKAFAPPGSEFRGSGPMGSSIRRINRGMKGKVLPLAVDVATTIAENRTNPIGLISGLAEVAQSHAQANVSGGAATIKMKKSDFIKEHKKLIALLKKAGAEGKEQEAELRKMVGRKLKGGADANPTPAPGPAPRTVDISEFYNWLDMTARAEGVYEPPEDDEDYDPSPAISEWAEQNWPRLQVQAREELNTTAEAIRNVAQELGEENEYLWGWMKGVEEEEEEEEDDEERRMLNEMQQELQESLARMSSSNVRPSTGGGRAKRTKKGRGLVGGSRFLGIVFRVADALRDHIDRFQLTKQAKQNLNSDLNSLEQDAVRHIERLSKGRASNMDDLLRKTKKYSVVRAFIETASANLVDAGMEEELDDALEPLVNELEELYDSIHAELAPEAESTDASDEEAPTQSSSNAAAGATSGNGRYRRFAGGAKKKADADEELARIFGAIGLSDSDEEAPPSFGVAAPRTQTNVEKMLKSGPVRVASPPRGAAAGAPAALVKPVAVKAIPKGVTVAPGKSKAKRSAASDSEDEAKAKGTKKGKGRAAAAVEFIGLEPSKAKGKKWTVRLRAGGRPRVVHFGAAGAEDFTMHKDKKRMKLYTDRHKAREDWTKAGVLTPGFWAKHLLWSSPTIEEALAKTRKRFNL